MYAYDNQAEYAACTIGEYNTSDTAITYEITETAYELSFTGIWEDQESIAILFEEPSKLVYSPEGPSGTRITLPENDSLTFEEWVKDILSFETMPTDLYSYMIPFVYVRNILADAYREQMTEQGSPINIAEGNQVYGTITYKNGSDNTELVAIDFTKAIDNLTISTESGDVIISTAGTLSFDESTKSFDANDFTMTVSGLDTLAEEEITTKTIDKRYDKCYIDGEMYSTVSKLKDAKTIVNLAKELLSSAAEKATVTVDEGDTISDQAWTDSANGGVTFTAIINKKEPPEIYNHSITYSFDNVNISATIESGKITEFKLNDRMVDDEGLFFLNLGNEIDLGNLS